MSYTFVDGVTRGLVRDKRTATNQLLCVVEWRSVFVMSADRDVDGCGCGGGGDDGWRDTGTLTDAPCRPAIITSQMTTTHTLSVLIAGVEHSSLQIVWALSSPQNHTVSGKFQRSSDSGPRLSGLTKSKRRLEQNASLQYPKAAVYTTNAYRVL